MASEKAKILVAVDGSKQSLEVVRYVATICAPNAVEVTLYHVFSPVSEWSWDSEGTPPQPVDAKEGPDVARCRIAMEQFMDGARQVLSDHGFPARAVRTLIQPRQEGIARDILKESCRGYTAVAAGRTGHNPITRLVMGSVASKLVFALTEATLWLVAGQPDCRRVLVCIDASPAAARVADLVARILAQSPAEISLFHAIRVPGPESASGSDSSAKGDTVGRERHARQMMVPVFQRAVSVLETAGVPSGRIKVKVISGVATRGGTLFAQALHGGYGTIAVGRRGVSNVEMFPIGRVPMKLVQLISDQALWVVSP